ncbi:phenylalanyl-tRNA synthetase, alpha subunit [secondary endosymbiont of Heteropsylla cubana]|uniref:Phenylalanine--tRNA ligase alpha subunit n=1 Tax=secondary endosymbiont of Heteropsylla cubana TaxID=134287 RepID=J3VU78_9ENTR|nr:phenylalanine--tRNA ligase subunit alpha [secondary endosymbiont of Heteropsylla cubana]AFP85666.1 phenylalanyl-tRNA synthetase, alpha subunit [secondary endosymbiont of Heteropsylla cubana]
MPHLTDFIMKAKIDIERSNDLETLDLIRIAYLGKKGLLNKKIKILKNVKANERAPLGLIINKAKETIQKALTDRKQTIEKLTLQKRLSVEMLDVSLPGRFIGNGSFHPVSTSISRIECFFEKLGFAVITGPEIENNYHNFDALNIPPYHPARTDNDTFWFDTNRLLRTQTSGVQIRTMKEQKPPIRIISPGRVYRNDYDQTHTPMFHQVEGLMVDNHISFSALKGILHDFLHIFFEKKLKIRFRPSYFPFTEPSAEVDILGEDGRWLEVLGCGMVHPTVLRNVSIDPDIYSGFAFGMGVERLTMLRHGITDLRAFFENDLRFLKQFK